MTNKVTETKKKRKRTYQNSILGAGYTIIPRILLHGYKDLTALDKLCYILCIETAELSWRHGNVDQFHNLKNGEGIPYIWLSQEDLCAELGIAKSTLIDSFKRLKEAGLLEVGKRGNGLPNLTYVYTIDELNPDFINWKKEHIKRKKGHTELVP